MPSSSKKQHNFMAAIAHSPSFAKKVGVSQSVGKDFAAADKGKTFAKGGVAQQKINKQNTRHGAVDLPVANLSRFSGMKKGGIMKTRKFAAGGMEDEGVDNSGEGEQEYSAHQIDPNSRSAHGLYDEAPAAKATPKAAAKPALRNYGDEKDSGPKEDTGPYRTMRPVRSADKPSEAQQSKNAERMGKIGEGAAMLLPIGKVAKGVEAVTRGAKVGRDALKAVSDSNEAKFIARRAAERVATAKKDPWSTGNNSRRNAQLENALEKAKNMKKGGAIIKNMFKGKESYGEEMKEAKAIKSGKITPKQYAMGEKSEERMKKGGMPMKDGKPAFMKKFAKGGGIEARGKTKGTIIRMASGGSVSSASRRADGIAQRGKTRC